MRGTWGEPWERMLELDPAFLRAYLDFSAVPWRASRARSTPKVRELHVHRRRRGRDPPLHAGGAPAHGRGARRGRDAARDHGGARADEHARHPRREHRGAAAGRGARRGGPARRAGAARRAPGAAQGRVHRDPRLLAHVLGRDPRAGPGPVRGLRRLLVGALAAPARSSRRSRSSSTSPSTPRRPTSTCRASSCTCATRWATARPSQEILEMFEIASVVGIHAATTAAPILAELAASR